jgi:hypothetical protein
VGGGRGPRHTVGALGSDAGRVTRWALASLGGRAYGRDGPDGLDGLGQRSAAPDAAGVTRVRLLSPLLLFSVSSLLSPLSSLRLLSPSPLSSSPLLLFSRTTCLLRPRRPTCRKTPEVSRRFGSRTHLFLHPHISLFDVLQTLDLGVACRRFRVGGTMCRTVPESLRGRPSQALKGALSARSRRRNAPSGAPSGGFQSRRVAMCRGAVRLRSECPAGQAGGR